MDERFVQGFRDFNAGRFYEAHEAWEDLWHGYRESDRTFLQGLIQLAAGFYHLQCGNTKGAMGQLLKGSTKLEPYAPRHASLDVGRLLNDVQRWTERIADMPEGGRVDDAEFPRCTFDTTISIHP